MTIFFSKSNDEHDGRQKEVGKDKKYLRESKKEFLIGFVIKSVFSTIKIHRLGTLWGHFKKLQISQIKLFL